MESQNIAIFWYCGFLMGLLAMTLTVLISVSLYQWVREQFKDKDK